LDIESTNLNADFGFMLTWCLKERENPQIISDYVTPKDIQEGIFDKRILQTLIKTMKKYHIIYGYYSTGFDIPFVRARALYWNLGFPMFGSVNHIDIYYQVRSRLKIHSNRLESACALLGIKGKTHLDGPTWIRAMSGNGAAIKYILDHNKQDVKILERLHERIEPYFKGTKKSI
jgi:uncharacterized protein YprB with RNaseH-like and TPR domain